MALAQRENPELSQIQQKLIWCLGENSLCLILLNFQLSDITALDSTWKPRHSVCLRERCWDQGVKKLENICVNLYYFWILYLNKQINNMND